MTSVAQPNPMEDARKFRRLLGLSGIIHIFLLTANFQSWFPWRAMPEQDWDIETELAIDSSLLAAKDTALPRAKESEKPGVPDNLLPQLPKKFTLDNPDKDTTPSEEKPIEKTQEEGEQPAKDVEPTEQNSTPKPESNRVSLEDARLRLALERLRKEEKKHEIEAHKRDKLAQIRSELKEDGPKQLSSSVDLHSFGAYSKQLQIAIRRNFSIPDTYELKDANIQVDIVVVIDLRGNLTTVQVQKTSGNEVFDNLALDAIRNSAPLPPPPREIAGKRVLFRVDPRTL